MTTLEELLGLDPTSPELQRAEQLAQEDRALLRELVKIRDGRGLTQKAVGDIMGISQPSVAAFEAYDSNPKLSTIRRYAHAVGALVRHQVELDERDHRTPWFEAQIKVAAPIVGPGATLVVDRPAGAASFHRSEMANSRTSEFALAA